MKKILIFLLLFGGCLSALERESTLKIYHQIFGALAPKPVIRIYTSDRKYREVFMHSEKLLLSKGFEESDIILITDEATLERVLKKKALGEFEWDKRPVLFVTDYHLLEKSSDAVGAFYWRKGRSQLLFIKNRLDRYRIVLPEEYNDFLVEEL